MLLAKRDTTIMGKVNWLWVKISLYRGEAFRWILRYTVRKSITTSKTLNSLPQTAWERNSLKTAQDSQSFSDGEREIASRQPKTVSLSQMERERASRQHKTVSLLFSNSRQRERESKTERDESISPANKTSRGLFRDLWTVGMNHKTKTKKRVKTHATPQASLTRARSYLLNPLSMKLLPRISHHCHGILHL